MNSSIRILISFFVLTNLFSSCSSNSSTTDVEFTEASFPEKIKFSKYTTYSNEKLLLSNPRWIRYHPDDFLVVQEMGTPFLVKIIDLKNGKVQELLRKGKGPKEVIVAWGIDIVGRDITVFDGMQRKICLLSMNNDRDRRFEVKKEVILIDKGVLGVYPISDNLFIALSGIGEKSRISMFDSTGVLKKAIGDFPSLENKTEFQSDNNIFSSYISGNTNGDKFVLACTNVDIIEIYETSTGLVKRFHGPEGIKLKAKKENLGVGVMTMTEPGFRAFNNTVANNEGFWIGYTGYKLERGVRPNKDDLYPKKIFCFSWEGIPIRLFEFQVPILSFAVNWKGKKLYCLTENPAPEIIIYDIK